MLAVLRVCLAALLGVGVAVVLVACGDSGHGLIPEANAGPLQGDFEAVAQAAQTGNGDCAATTAAINKTERDFAALPATVDPGLRNRLSQGISNLRERALELCAEPLAPTTTTTSTPRTTTTVHTQSTPAPTPTATTPPPVTHESTTPTPSPTPPANNGGGTAAPKPGSESGASGGTGVEEAEGSGGASGGAGGQEGAK